MLYLCSVIRNKSTNIVMEKKYKLTEEFITFNGRKLYRIEAIRDFGLIKKGDKGGFI